MGPLFLRFKAWWDAADRSQRLVGVGGVSFLALLIMGTFVFASKPQYELLYANLDQPQRVKVYDALRSQGVDVRIEGSAIYVRKDQATDASMVAQRVGVTPGAAMGAGGLDKLNPLAPPSVEEYRLKQELENRLAESIASISGVRSAKVILTLPEKRAFIGESTPAGASVNIDTGGLMLNTTAPQAIANMLLTGVPGLKIENISVIDTNGSVIFDGKTEATGANAAERNLATQRGEARRMEEELRGFLAGTFGPENVRVQIRAELDLSPRKTTETVVEPNKLPTMKQETTETMTRGAGSGGVGGTPTQANTALTGTQGASAEGRGENYEGIIRREERDTTRREVEEEKALGKLTSMTITVAADATRFEDPAQQESLRQMVENFVATRRTDVTNFPTPVITWIPEMAKQRQEEAKKAVVTAQTQERMQQIVSVLPIIMIVLVGLLLLKSISKVAKSTPVLVTSPDGSVVAMNPEALASSGLALPASHSPTLAALGDPLAGFAEHVDPATGQIVHMSHQPQIQMVDEAGDPIQISGIKDVIHVPLEQIKRMADEKPNVVAILVKSWLLEERK